MAKPKKQQDHWVGTFGEKRVQLWLEAQGWQILAQRWRCPWGELDLIAQPTGPPALVFIEVKTRSDPRQRTYHSWDHEGLTAITPQKQTKLSETAACFLGKFPHYSTWPCRFDLALVHYQGQIKPDLTPQEITQQFAIYDYIEGIF